MKIPYKAVLFFAVPADCVGFDYESTRGTGGKRRAHGPCCSPAMIVRYSVPTTQRTLA